MNRANMLISFYTHTRMRRHTYTRMRRHTHTRIRASNNDAPYSVGLVPITTRCWDYPLFLIFTFILFLYKYQEIIQNWHSFRGGGNTSLSGFTASISFLSYNENLGAFPHNRKEEWLGINNIRNAFLGDMRRTQVSYKNI